MTKKQNNKFKNKPENKQNNKPENEQDNKHPKLKNLKNKFNFYWIYAIIVIVFFVIQFFNWNSSIEEISWQQFEKEILAYHDVEKIVVVNTEYAEITIKKDRLILPRYAKFNKKKIDTSTNTGLLFKMTIDPTGNFQQNLDDAQLRILKQDTTSVKSVAEKSKILVKYQQERISAIYEKRKDWGGDILSWIIPIGLLIVFWIFMMRRVGGGAGVGGHIFNIGKAKAQLFDKDTSVNINFNDVAGLEEAKVEVMEIVDFLKNPNKYTDLGGKIPKGALLVGPPGTGKTLLAKAVAGEAQVPFFSLSGSDFVEMFVGVGASRVRDLFKRAKEKAPCIIFIDEIDAVGRARGRGTVMGVNDERENTLNQLLTEMDGFGTNLGVIILAATNRADILDRALMRAGRFDRQIHLELPDLEERKAIFKVHIRLLKLDKTIDINFLAKQTPGFSGADIANVCNESALIAARNGKKIIERQDFLDAIDRIVGGMEKRSKIISLEEKKVIAFHEAGHASISWLLEYANPLVKVTIIPRGKALGAAWYLPEERQITTTEQMFDEITSALGGRASEEVIFGKISTGALNDLEKVTKQAYSMVVFFGLNEKIGNISYYDSSGTNEYSFQKPFSEMTAQIVDEEISKLVEKAYKRAKKILIENKEKLETLANILLDKEVIFREDLKEVFGDRIFDNDKKIENIKPKKKYNKKSTNSEIDAQILVEVDADNTDIT